MTAKNAIMITATTIRISFALRGLAESWKLSTAVSPPCLKVMPAPMNVSQIIMCRATSSDQVIE